MEGKTHYERIIGGTQSEKEVAAQELQSTFETNDETFAEYEIEKSAEDIEVIHTVEAIVDRIVLEYGGEPKPLPPDHIHILKPGGVLAISGGKFTGGIHKPVSLRIGVERGQSKLLLASTLAHEFFHLKSFKSAKIVTSGEDVRLYRSGLSMIDRKDPHEEEGKEREYFSVLEEAIVAECVKKALGEIRQEKIFSEEAAMVKKFMDWVVAYCRHSGMSDEQAKEFEKEIKYIAEPRDKVDRVLAFSDDEKSRQTYAAGMFQVLYGRGDVETVERSDERIKLYELLDEIVEGSNGAFKNRDEVFNEFAKANFSGNYLPLARMVEGILGKGSFRRLAEEMSVKPAKAVGTVMND